MGKSTTLIISYVYRYSISFYNVESQFFKLLIWNALVVKKIDLVVIGKL